MRVSESVHRDALRVLLYYPGQALVRMMPTPLAMACFEGMGRIHAALRPSLPGRIGHAMEAVAGEATREEARAYVVNHYVDRLHIFLYPRFSGHPDRLAFLRDEGREHLDAALASGRGAVLVHPHYAVPQLLPLALGSAGYRCLQIGLPSKEGLSALGVSVAFQTRQRLEKLLPARILPADGYLRPAFRWLRDGGVVLTTGDGTGGGRFRGRFTSVRFLGKDVLFPVGAAKLALSAKAPLLPAIVLRGSRGRYVARVEPSLPIPTAADREEAENLLTQSFATWFEEKLRRAPGLWHFWDELHEGGLLAPTGSPS